MTKGFLAAFVCSVFAVGTAAAADLTQDYFPDPPALAGGVDWSGAYLGAFSGLAWTGTDFIDLNGCLGPAGNVYRLNATGLLVGVNAGARGQAGSLVYGAELDVSYGAQDFSDPHPLDAGFTVHLNKDIASSLRGQLGVAFDSVMVYGTAGVAAARFDFGVDPGGLPDSEVAWKLGWIVGMGAEVALDDHLSLKAEYLYSNYGSYVYEHPLMAGNPFDYHGLETHEVRVGVNYRF